ncbi:hypothetical protein IQ07DRAFT_115360 [Pyrenochaeta sp. DS3sAY3a]|nr:hypothetical protein IQ07DRAFT_115360 [Pyrenochaeta sp. DS3sAY3a]
MTWPQPYVLNDEGMPLLGGNLTRGTPWRQDDNPFIRLPAQFVRWLWLSCLQIANFSIGAIQRAWYFILSLTRDILSFIDRYVLGICHFMFTATLIGVGIPLGISTSHNELPIGLFLLWFTIAIIWAVFSRFVEYRSRQCERETLHYFASLSSM